MFSYDFTPNLRISVFLHFCGILNMQLQDEHLWLQFYPFYHFASQDHYSFPGIVWSLSKLLTETLLLLFYFNCNLDLQPIGRH